jgi:hypothetical protein
MKKFFALCIILMLTLSVNAQQSQIYLDYLKKANNQAIKGGTLILTGIGACWGGSVLVKEYGTEPRNPGAHDSHMTMWYPIGLIVMVAGVPLFSVGVSNLIAGSVKKGWAHKHLQVTMVSFKSPGVTAPINGIGFDIRF